MSDFDWKSLVGSVSPVLATALGGPFAGAAVKILADKVLGNPNASEGDVAQVLASGSLTGEQIVAIKKAEQDFELEKAKLEQSGETTRLQDVADARRQTVALAETGSQIAWGAPVVSCIIIAGFFACIFMVFVRGDDLPENLTGLVNYLFGALTTGFVGVTQYWLGSSAGSKRAGDTLRYIAQKKG